MMNKKDIENIINEYKEHVRRYSWQAGTTDDEKMERFLSSNVVKNIGSIADVSHRTWMVDEIVEELEDIDAFDAAKYFFDKYGG
jgi:hypothetical protein